jgi:hypothetical protein
VTKKITGRTSIQIRFMAGYQTTKARSRVRRTKPPAAVSSGRETPLATPWRARVTRP